MKQPYSTKLESTKTRRVLIVDDNADMAETLGMLVEMWGYEVKLAHDGETGFQEARSFKPHVVLLDIGLPGQDGYEVARRLRQDAGLAGTLIIGLTGYGQQEALLRSKEAGFDHHLVKPADPTELARLLDGQVTVSRS